ncbi:MAG: nicotinate (nicotinamide) nucleotide adenylyltransferase [Campylobacterota bacterium]|nr:nicotinate (nicotinamide) nucleotide adenylyltransferase [Campylobacterota bacterium]
MKSIALFGGSFDPPHLGHLEIVDEALKTLEIEKLIVLPAYLNPFKTRSVAPASLRFKWLQKIFKHHKNVDVSSFEIDHNQSIPSIQSVKHFKSLEACRIFFIIGADNLKKLKQWHSYEELKLLVTFVIAHRDEIEIPKEYIDLHVDTPVSSTVLRKRMNHTFIPSSVSDEIHKYYKENNGR